MGLFKKKIDRVSFWVVQDKENLNHFYTFTNTYDQASEYLLKLYIYKDKYEHFISWCDFHKKEKNKTESMIEYIQALGVNLFDRYNILKVDYTLDNLASLFRIYNNCVPLGCYFETDLEVQTYSEMVKAIKEELNKDNEDVIE